MKVTLHRFSLFSVLAGLSLIASAEAAPNPLLPVTIKIKPEQVFVPPGFDTNDNAQLVVTGDLATTCLKAGATKARVNHKKRQIYLEQEALQYTDCWCAELPTSYTKTVDLGVLEAGKYQVLVADGPEKVLKEGQMTITNATTNSPDERFYAPVEEAVIVNRDGAPELTLRGTFRSTCTNIEDVKILQRTPGVIEVLPISDLKEGTPCIAGENPYEKTVTLPAVKGKTLVHIRSLSGQSINRVIEGK